ncbi:uncharacterized protein L969DRAFT_68660 [Mixia osmundae IAM 14324]|uniref:DUF1754-domain-containing protein n=1 Tax=Mixia osmundae (strain CBS 9802 / IAM 14324 / JCM 22182 / KY 12970) TaxID=764103 RepID=G7E402_MIXOS|nr:uncharacterized protein L969DRAFT_68660 [Mixia osmundae IAM 14324]KEI42008.1 hypothetical protein L969DRAFT_68660 [Mixia osmundae IAM 14324]GAA97562.1 hypothetical protein E5Q_04240 [Mixia osmundae IAM 14324]
MGEFIGGSLKLKGKSGKKKRSSTSDASLHELPKGSAVARTEQDEARKTNERSQSPRTGTSEIAQKARYAPPHKTAAELRFEETQRKRLADKVAKQAQVTHKDRVASFNSKLESLSEHYDIPKVGPG